MGNAFKFSLQDFVAWPCPCTGTRQVRTGVGRPTCRWALDRPELGSLRSQACEVHGELAPGKRGESP